MKSGYYAGRSAGIDSVQLISDGYRAQQAALHAAPRGYGGKGDKWAEAVIKLALDLDCVSILDYGCGQGSLRKAIDAQSTILCVREYDPAVSGKDALPAFADLVVCTDVLEHIEPDRLHAVLTHLRVLARKAIFVVIATRPSNKTLTDGRNAHLTVESAEWWIARLNVAGFHVSPGDELGLVSPLKKPSRELVAVLTEVP